VSNDTNLSGANLSNSRFSYTNLSAAKLNSADLSGANLIGANLSGANLIGANLSGAHIRATIFGDVDLRTVKGLESVQHDGPSTLGTDTLVRSQGNIPEVFLRGVGLPDTFITYARSLVNSPIEYYTCFISYSSKDQDCAERLYADLQSKGVRCWYAPEDMEIGDKIKHRIDESIRLYDKLLLLLSEHSIGSDWVAYEVEEALKKEPEGIPNVLYPVRLDEAISTCTTAWAEAIRSTRFIGDFTHWKEHDPYLKSFNKLLRALQPKQPSDP